MSKCIYIHIYMCMFIYICFLKHVSRSTIVYQLSIATIMLCTVIHYHTTQWSKTSSFSLPLSAHVSWAVWILAGSSRLCLSSYGSSRQICWPRLCSFTCLVINCLLSGLRWAWLGPLGSSSWDLLPSSRLALVFLVVGSSKGTRRNVQVLSQPRLGTALCQFCQIVLNKSQGQLGVRE